MDISEFLGMGLWAGLVLILVIAWWIYRDGKRPATISEAATMVVEAERVARILVAGAQQIYESDQTDGQDYRYEQVEAGLMDVFPQLPQHRAKQIIEAAVLGLKEARARGWLPPSGGDLVLEGVDDGGLTVHAHAAGTEHTRTWESMQE